MSSLAADVEYVDVPLTVAQRRRDAQLQDALLACTAFTAGAVLYALVMAVRGGETFWSVSLSDGLILSGLIAAEVFLLWNNGLRQGLRGHSIGKHRTGLMVTSAGGEGPIGAVRGLWRGLVVVGLLDLLLALIPVGLPTVLRRLTPEAWHIGAFAYLALIVVVIGLVVPRERRFVDLVAGTRIVETEDTTGPRRRTALLVLDAVGVVGVLAVFVLYLSFLWPLIGQLPSFW